MSLYKRGKTWWVRFTAPSGERIQRSTGTANRQLAQQYHDQLKAEYWRVQKLGDRPRYLWEQAVVRWITEQSHKRSIADDKIHLRWLDKHLRGLPLTEIARDRIDAITQIRLQEDVAEATVNRMLEVLRAILRRAAREWEWIDRAPAVRMLPEQNRRVRWLTREEADRLIEQLPPHLADMAAFSLATGLRQANVTGLEWSQVDLQRRVAWIHPDQAKARKAIPVPLNIEAVVILRCQLGKHERWIFTYRGKRVSRANNHAWRKAMKRAGIDNFRWHDLRHTWASWHVQNGTPLHVLQELGGWSSFEMVRRYAHLSAEHLAEYANTLCNLKSVTGTNLVQSGTEAQK